LVVIGIAQEQHAARCRLFLQWQGIHWTVVHDPINLTQARAVPIEVAVDEYGIVRSTHVERETLERDFLNQTFPAPEDKARHNPVPAGRPDVGTLRRRALASPSAATWRSLGDALALWEGPSRIDDAIEAYSEAVNSQPHDGDAHFRLGVCLLRRYERAGAAPGDFQAAVDHWTEARSINPNQYIWRRRIEQYGPRLEKPYPFYDWVDRASREIADRGEAPMELDTLPTGSERARPDSKGTAVAGEPSAPDPQGRIVRDQRQMIQAEVTVVPSRVIAGERLRIYVRLRPNPKLKAHWNNEAEPLSLWIDSPDGFKMDPPLLSAAQGAEPTTVETRCLEFDVLTPPTASGRVTLNAYALYYVCEDVDGRCMFLRQDIPIAVTITGQP
jgi:hypothetical protein